MLVEVKAKPVVRDNRTEVNGGVNVLTLNMSDEKLRELQKRLARVRSWGGEFAKMEFSPEIQAIVPDGYDNS